MNHLLAQTLERIEENSLLDAVSLLKQYSIEKKEFEIRSKVDNIDQSYRYLLKYLKDGAKDPQRIAMYSDLKNRLYAICRNLLISENAVDSPELYYSTLRTVRYSNLTLNEALGRFLTADTSLAMSGVLEEGHELTEDDKVLLRNKETAVRDIFSIIFTLPVGNGPELISVIKLVLDQDIPYSLRAVMISALTLAINNVYDPDKLVALIEIESKATDQRLQARALIGIVLILLQYSDKIQNDEKIDKAFGLMAEDLVLGDKLHEIVEAHVKTRGSLKLAQKISSEIIPGLSGINMDFLKNLRNEKNEISLEDIQENPEWEKMMEETGLDKKLRRIHNMHSKGADMMLPMFNQIAGNYAFRNANLWFMPFEEWMGLNLGCDLKFASILSKMPGNVTLCDSDKYAFILNLSRVPVSARDMMLNALNAGSEQMKDDLEDRSLHTNDLDFEIEVTNYSRVLFRFFNCFRFSKEFFNPFEKVIFPNDLKLIEGYFIESEILPMIAELSYHQGYYEDAIEAFNRLKEVTLPEQRAVIDEKIGYCYEKKDNFSMALHHYKLAAEGNENLSNWLLERIVRISIRLDDKEVLMEMLERMLSIDNDSTFALYEWLNLMVSQDWNSLSQENKDLIKSRIARYKYISPDSTLITGIEVKIAMSRHKYEKVIELAEPVRFDTEMMLAASSLDTESKTEKTVSEEEEENRKKTLILLVLAYAMVDQPGEAVDTLRLLMQGASGYDNSKIKMILNEACRDYSSPFDSNLIIPMLLDACNIQ